MFIRTLVGYGLVVILKPLAFSFLEPGAPWAFALAISDYAVAAFWPEMFLLLICCCIN